MTTQIATITVPAVDKNDRPWSLAASRALRSDGTLASLQQQWLTEAGSAPVLK